MHACPFLLDTRIGMGDGVERAKTLESNDGDDDDDTNFTGVFGK